jgi:ABC-2 type transport system permease protein
LKDRILVFINITLQFIRLFLKNAFSNKISFIWVLLFPIGLMTYSSRYWFKEAPDLETFITILSIYIGYMIVISSTNGFGLGLLVMRENGFLKMFKFISGQKAPVVMAHYISQALFLLFNLLAFSTVISILFFPAALLKLLVVNLLVGLVIILPVGMLFSWIPILKAKVESISPLTSIIPIGLTFLTSFSLRPESELVENLLLFNPVEVVVRCIQFIASLFFGTSYSGQPFLLCFILFIYIVIGIISIKHIKISSSSIRT